MPDPIFFRELIRAQSRLASPAIDHWIRKSINVPAGFEHGWMGQDRAIQSDDIVAVAYRHLPPLLFEILFEFSPKWFVIPHPVESAINLARLEHASAPLAQADELLHSLRLLFPGHAR